MEDIFNSWAFTWVVSLMGLAVFWIWGLRSKEPIQDSSEVDTVIEHGDD